MKDRDLYRPVATAVRIELDPDKDELYIVFHVTDQKLKHTLKKDWTQDIDLKMIGKDLVRVDE